MVKGEKRPIRHSRISVEQVIGQGSFVLYFLPDGIRRVLPPFLLHIKKLLWVLHYDLRISTYQQQKNGFEIQLTDQLIRVTHHLTYLFPLALIIYGSYTNMVYLSICLSVCLSILIYLSVAHQSLNKHYILGANGKF